VTDTWPEEGMFFGIAILVSHRPSQQFHTAALYRVGNELWMGDLQSHLRTCRARAEPTTGTYWIAPDLFEEDQRILAAKIDAWLDKNENKIPYSVAHPGGVVFCDDVWVGDEPGQGLTCATFIVELFKELAIPFIDVETWRRRDGDDEWAKKILPLICASMSQAHVDAQRNRIGDTIRVRPTDVAAAGLLVNQGMDVALTFDQVAPVSNGVEAKLLQD
jgi:hypothetical protein